MITKTEFINTLRKKITPKFWNLFWIVAPVSAILLIPVGLFFTHILGLLGFEGVGRLNQFLILFSIFYGFLVGVTILLLSNDLEIPLHIENKIKWLARFAVVSPILIILSLFLIFSR